MKNKVKYINYYVVLFGIHKKLCIFATSINQSTQSNED